MDLVQPFNRDYADQLFYFLKKNRKNLFFNFEISKKCSLETFRNYYTQEIINSEFANSVLTNYEKTILFPISENNVVFGLIKVTLYIKKLKEKQGYIEILFDKDRYEINLISDALYEAIKYLKNNYGFKNSKLFFMVDKKDFITQQAILKNGGIIYNTMKNRIYIKIILESK